MLERGEAVLPISDEVRDELRRQWAHLAAPGTWLSGPERVAVAAEARAARSLDEAGTGLPDVVVEAAHGVAAAAADVTAEWVDDLESRGLAVETYVEITGVVGRLAAIDACVRGLGAQEAPLPEPQPGAPRREPNPAARPRGAFVPTDGGDRAARMLTAVPDEAEAQMALHGALYLTEEEMADLERGDALSRPQMEFVASRVSWLNDCPY